MPFLRRSYKQKPRAWGPVSAVQASIFTNAERAGIDPGSIALAMPMWGPINQIDYGKFGTSPSGNVIFNSEWTTGTISISNSILNFGTESFTIINKFYIPSGSASAGSSPDLLYSASSGGESYIKCEIEAWSDKLLVMDVGKWSSFGCKSTSSCENKDIVSCYSRSSMQLSTLWINGTIEAQNTNTKDSFPVRNTIYIDVSSVYRMYFIYIFQPHIQPSQIAYLSDNPYFLLHRVAPVFYSIPQSGPVTFKPYWANQATRIAI